MGEVVGALGEGAWDDNRGSQRASSVE
jgi:hypothetical protein